MFPVETVQSDALGRYGKVRGPGRLRNGMENWSKVPVGEAFDLLEVEFGGFTRIKSNDRSCRMSLKIRSSTRARPVIAATDVFCGAGGLSLGMKWSGIRIAAGIDLDPACRHPYERGLRAPFLERDVAGLTGAELAPYFRPGEIRLLAGCAPCQPFSRYNARLVPNADRWELLREFLRLVREVRPDLITMENVPDLARLPIWQDFTVSIEEAGYEITWGVLDAADYGVGQTRRRLVLLGSRLGPVSLPKKSDERRTVRTEIGHLSPIGAGETSESDRLHAARGLTSRNVERIRASRPGGSWKAWPEEMRTACHKSLQGRTYVSVYGRMSWDDPSPTMTTQFYGFGNGRFGHPDQDRALSLREGALLQSFPPDYEFVPANVRLSARAVGRLIGNAVPPRLGAAIGAALVAHVTALA